MRQPETFRRQIATIRDRRNRGRWRWIAVVAWCQLMDRTGRIQLRVTQREKEEFTTKAATAGLGLSEYLRKAALDVGLLHKYDQAALHQLRKIGVNLNQIAHHLNAGNDLQGDVLISLRRCLVKLEKEIDSRQGPAEISKLQPAQDPAAA